MSLVCVEKGTQGVSFGKCDETLACAGYGDAKSSWTIAPFRRQPHWTGGRRHDADYGSRRSRCLGRSATSIGLAQAALDAATKHARERIVAGQPIGKYQAVQFMIAEMSAAVDAARALLYHAVYLRKNTPPGPPIPSFKAKLFAAYMAIRVTDQALQVHGGHGYSRELPLERYYRDARGMSLLSLCPSL